MLQLSKFPIDGKLCDVLEKAAPIMPVHFVNNEKTSCLAKHGMRACLEWVWMRGAGAPSGSGKSLVTCNVPSMKVAVVELVAA